MRDAVIFDMDGLLIDSERVSFETFEQTCRQLDLAWEQSVYDRCVGCTIAITEQILTDGIPSFPKEEFMGLWKSLYHQQAIENPVPVKEGAKALLMWLEQSNIPCAVATSTHLSHARRKLEHADLIDHFSFLMTGDQVSNSKPHPEIYLKAAAKLGLPPQKCLALEDSDNGVRAAVAADMLVYQIPDRITPSQEVLKLGHQVVPSLIQIHQLFQK